MPATLVPTQADLEAAGGASGTIQLVALQGDGPCVVGIYGGQNPGQYVLSPNIPNGIQAALTALTNKSHVGASLDQQQIVTLVLYPA